ncbi:hypothetical protein ACHAW6_012865 [Cyclotella cf. meneghiniana]
MLLLSTRQSTHCTIPRDSQGTQTPMATPSHSCKNRHIH